MNVRARGFASEGSERPRLVEAVQTGQLDEEFRITKRGGASRWVWVQKAKPINPRHFSSARSKAIRITREQAMTRARNSPGLRVSLNALLLLSLIRRAGTD